MTYTIDGFGTGSKTFEILDAFDRRYIATKTVHLGSHEQTELSGNEKRIEASESNLKWFKSLMTE